MTGLRFQEHIETLEELRAIYGEPNEVVRNKVVAALDEHSRRVIARSPFVFIGTTNAAGAGDVSPKGDAPGFVRVLDDITLVIPDRSGNRHLDTLRNILENPNVGLLFIIHGMEETLRVNGRAFLVRDADVLASLEMQGKRPLAAIVVQVDEAYLHCARSFKRARLWDASSWIDRAELPSLARMVMDHPEPAGRHAGGARGTDRAEQLRAVLTPGYRYSRLQRGFGDYTARVRRRGACASARSPYGPRLRGRGYASGRGRAAGDGPTRPALARHPAPARDRGAHPSRLDLSARQREFAQVARAFGIAAEG